MSLIYIYIHYSSYTSLLSFLKAPLLDGDPHIQPEGIRFQVRQPVRHHLDVSLSQTVQVGTDAHGTPRDVGQREGVLQGENP